MPQDRSFVRKFYAVEFFPCRKNFFENIDDMIQVFLRIYAARQSKAQKFHPRSLRFFAYRISSFHYGTNFYRANAALNIRRYGKRLPGKLIPRNGLKHAPGVNINRMPARGPQNRNADLRKSVSKI